MPTTLPGWRRGLDNLDRCFVGTIHSFCGQLLRERPLEANLSRNWGGRLEQVLETFCASALWAQVREVAEVHTQVEFAAPAGVRGVIDLVFRVAGGWQIVDYQSEPATDTSAVEAGARHWEQLAGEKAVERGVWRFETGVWQQH